MCQGPQKVAAKVALPETRLPNFLDQGSSWGPNYNNPHFRDNRPTVKSFCLITMTRMELGPGSQCILALFLIQVLELRLGQIFGLLLIAPSSLLDLKNLTLFLEEFSAQGH